MKIKVSKSTGEEDYELNIGDIVEVTIDDKHLMMEICLKAIVESINEKGTLFIINNGLDCHVCFVANIFKINDVIIRDKNPNLFNYDFNS